MKTVRSLNRSRKIFVTAGLYFHATTGDFQKEGEERKLFCEMIREISDLAVAMGFPLESDRIAVNLQIKSKEINEKWENNMEYKYSTINEVNHFEFGEAVVGDIQLTERMFHLVLDNVKICPENSCNRDIRMMRTNELLFKISDAEIISLVEEGYNEYDADGNLKHTYPDEEVEKAKYDEVAQVLLEGTVYELTLQSGVYTFIIDGTNDRTYALKVTGSGDTQEWNRFLEV